MSGDCHVWFCENLRVKPPRLNRRSKTSDAILDIVDVCRATGNLHFISFAKLFEGHLDGIVTHAVYPHSPGKVEGTMNKIKTIRRKAYGLSDDECSFLQIFDATRNEPRMLFWVPAIPANGSRGFKGRREGRHAAASTEFCHEQKN